MTPTSIGIIIDGNRRWAKERGLSVLEGHRAGLDAMRNALEWILEAGIREAIFYVFSTENWNRSEEEVKNFMGLIEFAFDHWIEEVIKKEVRIRIIGDRSAFSETIQEKILETEERTRDASGGTLALALSYGGRAEILTAVNTLLVEGRDVVTAEELEGAMWSAGLQDPDLIIRTGGDKRLSNFLPWQSTYSELFFVDTKWPAFTKDEFVGILAEYAAREKRYGR
jgi:undecaprenyl diphosphate synthase